MTPEELLDLVIDRDSFIQFLDALISDREKAESIENDNPKKYRWSGANSWQNTTISSFLEAASVYFMEESQRHNGNACEWKDLADFLYFGKIYE